VSELLNLILLGLIEGITEFLPISSTGHLLIAEHWLGHRSDVFNVVIQAGAILAVVLIYWQRLWQLATGLGDAENRDYALKLLVAFAITAVLGFAATKMGFKLPETVTPIAWALIFGGLWMIGAEAVAARQPDRSAITWRVAILVGIAQVIAAIFPGTSRSAATIFVAMLAGTSNRPAATEFAFLVGIPTMFAASGYELLERTRDRIRRLARDRVRRRQVAARLYPHAPLHRVRGVSDRARHRAAGGAARRRLADERVGHLVRLVGAHA
jgi:undecaprenyl-diphosphatase